MAKKTAKKSNKKKASSQQDKKVVTIKIPSIDLKKLGLKHAVIAIGILLAVSVFFNFRGGCFGTGNTIKSSPFEGKVTEKEIGNKTINYINNKLVATGDVSLVSVEESNGLYKVITSYQGQELAIYATLDGSYMFLPQGTISLEEVPETTEPETPEVPKRDEVVVNAFVMSYCPYGLQFLKAYVPVIELLGGKADLQVNFVDYAMHDKKEIDENSRMYCIQKEQGEKLTEYLRCFVVDGDHEKCIGELEIDQAKLESCMNSLDEEFKITELYNDRSTWSNGRFPQYPVETHLNDQYGVGGSPTFVVNGKTISVNRSPEAIKDVICAGFNNPPEECEEELSTTPEQPGLGPLGTGSGASSGGQC